MEIGPFRSMTWSGDRAGVHRTRCALLGKHMSQHYVSLAAIQKPHFNSEAKFLLHAMFFAFVICILTLWSQQKVMEVLRWSTQICGKW